MRMFLAIVACKLLRFAGKLVGKGSSLPGKYALKLCPDILRRVTLPPRVIAALCAAVWGADYYGYENSLGVHIRHLREKLEAEPGAPQFLRTVRGIGYKLTKGEEA